MRIVAGKFKGKQLRSPHGHRTHPMAEKIRGALFNVLGDIEGLTVLDAFCGAGAISVEAISRGAKSALAIDNDKGAMRLLKQNIKDLGLSEAIKAVEANAGGWSDKNRAKIFDLVFLDPPFDNVKPKLLQKLAVHTKQGGVLVISLPKAASIGLPFEEFAFLTAKDYGDAKLVFYRRIG